VSLQSGSAAHRPQRPDLQVEIVRSRRRTRSVTAEMVGAVLTVTVPSWMSAEEAERFAADMTERHRRRAHSNTIDLEARAVTLARRYQLPCPASIHWASNMARRWASCTVAEGSIRVSDTVAAFPPWVLDYVIVHELAHLEIGDHSASFWALVNRYPKTERARGYLAAKSGQ
jgi:predicted metal-dependent hydrolase